MNRICQRVDFIITADQKVRLKEIEKPSKNLYNLEYSDYCLDLYCYVYLVSADASFGLLQVFLMVNRTKTIYSRELNK